MSDINSIGMPENLPKMMTREDFSKKVAEKTNIPLEKILKMTWYPNNYIIDTETHRNSTIRNMLLWKSNKLIEWILAISEATNKTIEDVFEALQIDNEKFYSMPGIKETRKICQDIKYIYEESWKLYEDIVNLGLWDDQLDSEDNAQQFMPRFEDIMKYTEDNMSFIASDDNMRYAMRSILCSGTMIISAVVWIKLLTDHKNRAITTRDIVYGAIYVRTGFEWIYNDEKFKLLVK